MLKTVTNLVSPQQISGAGDLPLSNGNLVIGTSGKGVDFSATPGPSAAGAAATSELLADYEEGTWTPVVASNSGAITSYTASGRYTKVGRMITLQMTIIITNNGTGGGDLRITGFPYTTSVSNGNGCGRENAVNGYMQNLQMNGTTQIAMYRYDNAYPASTGASFVATFTYFVL